MEHPPYGSPLGSRAPPVDTTRALQCDDGWAAHIPGSVTGTGKHTAPARYVPNSFQVTGKAVQVSGMHSLHSHAKKPYARQAQAKLVGAFGLGSGALRHDISTFSCVRARSPLFARVKPDAGRAETREC